MKFKLGRKKLAGIGVLFLLLICVWGVRRDIILWHGTIVAGEKPVTNPLKGFAAWGENYKNDPWHSFAYVPVYWNELEPEEGVFDFEALEERCHFEAWKADRVRLILRVVVDTPRSEAQLGIPQWLYDKMDGAGTWYDCSYGKGFSPDYENEVFMEAHKRLICALAERYSEDPQIAFIQLGSLGHWGEWHVNYSAGIERFPLQEVTDQYVSHYTDAFGIRKLLLRRPYKVGQKGLGLYNDSFGAVESHKLWLAWIENGYISSQNQEELDGMPQFWTKASSGGEFSSAEKMSWYFSKHQFPITMELLKKSHTTFLGPNAPWYEESGLYSENVERMLQEMGYSLGIREVSIKKKWFSDKIQVMLQWENTGVAPIYEDWPIYMELRNEAGNVVYQGSFQANISSWIPGIHEFSAEISVEKLEKKQKYQLYVGIIDPLINGPGVELQMKTKKDGFLYRVAEWE